MRTGYRLNAVAIDDQKVRSLARSVAEFRFSSKFREYFAPPVHFKDNETAFRAYFWASSICHSTKGAFHGYFDGRYAKGWDYLLRSFCAWASDEPNAVSPSRIANLKSDGLIRMLEKYATEATVNLRDADRRVEILANAAEDLNSCFDGRLSALLEKSKQRLSGEDGAYSLLSRLRGFADPQRKKSTTFLMTCHYSGRWEASDPTSAEPMVDYHRIRLLMRTGCIVVNSEELSTRLRSQWPVNTETADLLRTVARQICKQITALSNVSMFDLDVSLWAHARSCCRNAPTCMSKRVENESFGLLVDNAVEGSCVFEDWCSGKQRPEVRSLWEPITVTENY